MSGRRSSPCFTNIVNAPTFTLAWAAPAGVTHILVEMWGGGGGGSTTVGGGGGAYSRSIIAVTPGAVYLVTVGGGLPNAASALGFPSVHALQLYVHKVLCGN